MSKPWKPLDYSSVSPYLIVSEATDTVAFLEAAFDARRLRWIERPDGSLMHGEVRIDDSVVMLGEAEGTPDHTPTPAHVHVYVPDVDEAYRRALAAGGQSVQAPERTDDPDRRAGVRGPSGHTWWMATQIASEE